MRHMPEALQEHIRGEVTTLCRCWIIETVDDRKLGFTDHDEDLELLGVVCERNAGLEASGAEEQLGLNVNTTDVEGALQSERIEAADIELGLYDNARITSYFVNWSEPSQFFIERVSLVGEITQEDGLFRMEMRGLTSVLDQTKGRHFVNRCQADLGDNRCRANLESSDHSSEATVAKAVSQDLIEVDGLQDFVTSWFTTGSLTWLDGANVGRTVAISSHSLSGNTTTILLWQAMPFAIEANDRFAISAGCDKSFETCKAKFSNSLNFQGFPHVPGNKFALAFSGNQEVFDGEPIVP